ncbi:ParB/RepB/Spo0J family partition protein [Candidatus Chloroploca sp. M-50]|uniref:ParB/RepB/Spo0J family partition protein n=1 Tax=Candidatus Chloroploca mongolica TaxID=2528176 RepID=A0ABS4DHB9_9CHLR|nr:ParB/RepB/Spo0J family partition protein [Candidatus Chloroploca mongolica]MBP1468794.1 ParB/RepB/Spo0J family partition protein [Candidatus Chloroploca mongolica]
MSKARTDRAQAEAIKARLAQRTQPHPPPEGQSQPPADGPAERATLARQHFLGPQLQDIVANQTIQKLPLHELAPELQPGLRQPRMLPLPDELLVQGETPPIYAELVAELRELGESLRSFQIQPVVVYPGTSTTFPDARYLLLVGQRRWTAAHLVGLPTLEAVVIEPPTPLERITWQFAENDSRESFSDIERAWTLAQLRELMGGETTSLSDVAARLNLKRSRAYQLLRMLALPPEQQHLVALLRLQERQLLPLLDAVHDDHLSPTQTQTVLERLQTIAAERALAGQHHANTETTRSVETPRRSGIDAATVARQVARVTQETRPRDDPAREPRWYHALNQDLERLLRKLRRASGRVAELSPGERSAFAPQLDALQRQLLLVQTELHAQLSAESTDREM